MINLGGISGSDHDLLILYRNFNTVTKSGIANVIRAINAYLDTQEVKSIKYSPPVFTNNDVILTGGANCTTVKANSTYPESYSSQFMIYRSDTADTSLTPSADFLELIEWITKDFYIIVEADGSTSITRTFPGFEKDYVLVKAIAHQWSGNGALLRPPLASDDVMKPRGSYQAYYNSGTFQNISIYAGTNFVDEGTGANMDGVTRLAAIYVPSITQLAETLAKEIGNNVTTYFVSR